MMRGGKKTALQRAGRRRLLPPAVAGVLALCALLPHPSLGDTVEPQKAAASGTGELILDMRRKLDAAAPPAVEPEPVILNEYRAAIETIELDNGAYADGLAEQLLGLGTALQQLGRHEEAVDVLKRGVHLSRINTGLYSGEQIALLRSEIRSHLALGDFETVDERQRYLYRVERQVLAGSGESSAALMRQADWQRKAYVLGVGEAEERMGRLMLMWDLYRMALNETMKQQGGDSMALLAPLTGMLQSQYLIAGHLGYDQMTAGTATETRFAAYTGSAFKRGESVLRAMLELNAENSDNDPAQRARDLAQLGDWFWWFGNRSKGQEYYAEAMASIAASDDPAGLEEELFGSPVPLPDVDDIRSIPAPTPGDGGDLVLGFAVTKTGRVDDLERLREPDVEETSSMSRLVRALRDTRFRPRFVNGEPVDTEGLVWSFATSDWQPTAIAMQP